MRYRISMLFCIISLNLAILCSCATKAPKPAVQADNFDLRGPGFETIEPYVPSEGSLWAEAGSTRLFVDIRAREVGDLVTVRISEKPTGKLTAKTNTSRDSSIEAGITDLLGYLKQLQAADNPLTSRSNFDRTSLFKAKFKPSFKGEGTNDRQGQLDAYITARVTQVLGNGNLHIYGKQEIKVNNETQYISISGIIRPEDISTNNEVQSTYVADARIEYSGKGVIADRQRPGWLMRILDFVWPF